MNSQMLKPKYLHCPKAGYHQGEQLNMVCLNPECQSSALCCCACVDESHKGHTTTTLKKLLLDASKIAFEDRPEQKQPVKPNETFNNDIVFNLIDTSKKDTLEAFHNLRDKITENLVKIQKGIETYFERLEDKVQNPNAPIMSDLPAKILELIETVQASSQVLSMSQTLTQLLTSLDETNETNQKNMFNCSKQQPSSDSMITLIDQSNQKVMKTSTSQLKEINQSLLKIDQNIVCSIDSINTLFHQNIFQFSTELKLPQIWVTSSSSILCKQGKKYQIALMQPGLSAPITSFKYKVKPNSSNQISLGICHKNIVASKNFTFNYKTTGHGCYMISSNGGVWSNISEELNHKFKSFIFNEGDTITCVVNRQLKLVFFFKDSMSLKKNQQIYEIPFVQIANDQLHPCVVFYYENDSVEYIPAINFNEVPRHDYLFSPNMSHSKLKLIDNRTARALEGFNQYRFAICSKSLEEDLNKPKKFTFKIVKCTNNWIAVGMCHLQSALHSQHTFNNQSLNHGYYMISANGGSWSNHDAKKNNVVRAFKYGSGDVIDCEVFFGKGDEDTQNKIIFTKGSEVYELNFRKIEGNKLHPCVMIYYGNDQVKLLPVF